MSFSIQVIDLEITPSKRPPIVYAAQGEASGRLIRLQLIDRGEDFIIPTNAKITLCGTRADGKKFELCSDESNAVSFEENVVSFSVTSVMTKVAGSVLCGIVIEDSEETVGTLNFILKVQQRP